LAFLAEPRLFIATTWWLAEIECRAPLR